MKTTDCNELADGERVLKWDRILSL